jgi:hypothetical protein
MLAAVFKGKEVQRCPAVREEHSPVSSENPGSIERDGGLLCSAMALQASGEAWAVEVQLLLG